jgi:hypothetical protein
MKKKASETRGKRQRSASKDLTVANPKAVKGGAKAPSDIPIMKRRRRGAQ